MCGRAACTLAPDHIRKALGVRGQWKDQDKYKQSGNVAPSAWQPIVVQHNDVREIHTMQWGLVPSWTKDIASCNRAINARSETVQEKPSFRALIARKRCVIVIDG